MRTKSQIADTQWKNGTNRKWKRKNWHPISVKTKMACFPLIANTISRKKLLLLAISHRRGIRSASISNGLALRMLGTWKNLEPRSNLADNRNQCGWIRKRYGHGPVWNACGMDMNGSVWGPSRPVILHIPTLSSSFCLLYVIACGEISEYKDWERKGDHSTSLGQFGNDAYQGSVFIFQSLVVSANAFLYLKQRKNNSQNMVPQSYLYANLYISC